MTCGKGTRNRVATGIGCTDPSIEECSAASCMIDGLCLFVGNLHYNEMVLLSVGTATHLADFGASVNQWPGDYPNREAGKAIDGIPVNVDGQGISPSTCAGTSRGTNPWLRIDLKKTYLVSIVRAIIYGSSGQNVTVHVGNNLTNDGNDNHLCGSPVFDSSTRFAAVWKDVTCMPPVWGRYINFQRTVVSHYLEICEVSFKYGHLSSILLQVALADNDLVYYRRQSGCQH